MAEKFRDHHPGSVSLRHPTAHYRHSVDELSALLMRAKRGDEEALAAFVHATHSSVWRFCAHLIGRDDADDATQETFVAAWRALPQFRGDASARTWLFVIARRCAERVTRRRRRWLELAEAVLEVTGSKSQVIFEALPTDDPQVRQPDISLARELLDWEPTVDLRMGLQRTIELSGRDALIGATR